MQRISNGRKVWNEYVRSVFLWYIANHSDLYKRGFYPPFFQRELNISNGRGYLQKLLKRGYLQEDADGCVILTDLGRDHIRDEYVQFFEFASPYVALSDYLRERETMQNDTSFDLVMLTVLLKKARVMKRYGDYIGLKNVYLDIAGLYDNLGIRDRSMYYYLVSLYYDTSGLEYYDQLLEYVQKKRTRASLENGFQVCIRPCIMANLRRMAELYDPEMVKDIFNNEKISINLCNQHTFDEIAREICTGQYEYERWQKRFADTYKKMIAMANQYREKNKAE